MLPEDASDPSFEGDAAMTSAEAAEGMQFLHFEVRDGTTFAIFQLSSPMLVWTEEAQTFTHELALDRLSVELRLSNLRRDGSASEVTAAALAQWPIAAQGGDSGEAFGGDATAVGGPGTAREGRPVAEARSSPRKSVMKPAHLVCAAGQLDCLIVNISATGVQLALDSAAPAPELAILHLPDGNARAIQLRWQRETLAGFAFLAAMEDADQLAIPVAASRPEEAGAVSQDLLRLTASLNLSPVRVRGHRKVARKIPPT